jgi:uncharacterized membrane protein YedE/YeeE
LSPYWFSLIGGGLIGLAVVLLLIFNGRVAGVSGIVGRLVAGSHISTNAAFVAGLIAGPVLYAAAFGEWPSVTLSTPLPLIATAGLLVGFGTRMGSGCTSGHGIAGLARLSRRSMAATGTFLVAGVAAATLMRLAGL